MSSIAAPPRAMQAPVIPSPDFPIASQATPQADSYELPNKYVYPEFAGYAGEDRLRDILRAILPMALFRTWEIFAGKQALDNDCFLSLEQLAHKAKRSVRTMRLNLAELEAKGLMVPRPVRKVFRRQDGTTYTRVVVVKDFTGLYQLAHEYYEWCRSAQVIPADRAYVSLIRAEGLEAKLRRFDDYRRILYTRLPGPEAHLSEECEWFRSYQADAAPIHAQQVEHAGEQKTNPFRQVYLQKELSKDLQKDSQNESERINQENRSRGDSFDSDPSPEARGAGAEPTGAYSQNRARGGEGYTKNGNDGRLQNESTNPNPVPPSPIMPRGAGKTRESVEMHQDVQRARQAMTAAGIVPGQHQRQVENMPAPAKNPLARSFVQACAALFGDLNSKGTKTGLERSIETFELAPTQVLMCLIRAYIVARATKDEKVRQRRPDGAPNRMPLFCTMFKTFARALASGSPWEYTWEQMLADIEADESLLLWVTEHQAELAEAAEIKTREKTEESMETHDPGHEEPCVREEDSAPLRGWSDGADAYEQEERLLYALADANYAGITATLSREAGRWYVVYRIDSDPGHEYVLATNEEITTMIELAQTGQL